MGGLNCEERIFYYYIFQQKLLLYLRGGIYEKDSTEYKEGYVLNLDWVKNWKKAINYKAIEFFLNKSKIKNEKIDSKQKKIINNYIKSCVNNNEENYLNNSLYYKSEYLQVQEKILTENYLQRIISQKILDSLKIFKDTKNKIQYILKKQMIILCFPSDYLMKILISDLSPFLKEKKIVNLTFIFKAHQFYEHYEKKFKEYTSYQILELIVTRDLLNKSRKSFIHNTVPSMDVINEEIFVNEMNARKNQIKLKSPQEVNFSLFQRLSSRGLDNVGATCYMNATLQCLANIRPITEYLLNPKKYQEIYLNQDLCRLTLSYCQVLIGLFCDKLTNGSYKPEEFKNTIGELNSLFQGVQANDSKDLIIFLLETLNSELVKFHNKKYNIKENHYGLNMQINPFNEKEVFNEFLKDFNQNYYSTIGFNLCGFQKSTFKCECGGCDGVSNNFNIFNFLIFGLETISNYFNLSKNNTQLPVITFDHCFNYFSKQEIFDQTYCQKCKRTGKAKYQERLYFIPNYLIIILNRGKGNIFNCKVDIPEKFCSSNYEILEKNNVFELVGIVSHFGESGMGGHFIAFCKHFLDNKWRIYNDSIVVECQNDYLTKGIPYILFYKKNSANKSQNQNQNINNNLNPIIFQQNNMNFSNPQQHINPNMNPNNANFLQSNIPNMNINNQNMLNMNRNNINFPQQNFMINNAQQNNNFQPNLNLGLNNQNNVNNNMNMNLYMNQNMNNNQNMMKNNIIFQ